MRMRDIEVGEWYHYAHINRVVRFADIAVYLRDRANLPYGIFITPEGDPLSIAPSNAGGITPAGFVPDVTPRHATTFAYFTQEIHFNA